MKGYGIKINDNGTASLFAVIDKSLAAQKERIAKNAKTRAEEKKVAEKKADKKKTEEKQELKNDKSKKAEEKGRLRYRYRFQCGGIAQKDQ